MAVSRGASRGCLAHRLPSRVDAREQAGARRLHVALDARHLTGEEQVVPRTCLPCGLEHRGPVDVRVAVHHPEPHELGGRQSRDHPQHARLLAPLQLRLESHEAEVVAGQRVLAQLHDGEWGCGRCAGPAGRPASSARSAACRARGAPSPRWAGSPRRTAPCRSRGWSPTPPSRARRRRRGTPPPTSGNSGSRPRRRPRRRRGRRLGDARPVAAGLCPAVSSSSRVGQSDATPVC